MSEILTIAVTPDGVYIAYQIVGNGPIDVIWQSDWPGNGGAVILPVI